MFRLKVEAMLHEINNLLGKKERRLFQVCVYSERILFDSKLKEENNVRVKYISLFMVISFPIIANYEDIGDDSYIGALIELEFCQGSL